MVHPEAGYKGSKNTPIPQTRKLCAPLQHAIHSTSVTLSKCDMCAWGNCMCIYFVHVSVCVVKLQPCTLLCFCSFSHCSWHVDVLASCVVGLKLSLYWQGDSVWPVTQHIRSQVDCQGNSAVLIVSVSPLCLVSFRRIYIKIAEPEPCVSIKARPKMINLSVVDATFLL